MEERLIKNLYMFAILFFIIGIPMMSMGYLDNMNANNYIIVHANITEYMHAQFYLKNKIKEKLKKLNKIAKRRNKVADIVNYEEDAKTIKQMAKADKERIGYKPEEGQNQWSRCCQNSGEGKKRRPQQYNASNMAELLKNGYKLNKKTGEYEKRVLVKNGKSSKKTEVVLKTLKFMDFDENGNPTGNEIHYACDPEENGEYFYVGFLSRCSKSIWFMYALLF